VVRTDKQLGLQMFLEVVNCCSGGNCRWEVIPVGYIGFAEGYWKWKCSINHIQLSVIFPS